jgi:hypothetical protein
MRPTWLVASLAWFIAVAVRRSSTAGPDGLWALFAEARFGGLSTDLLGHAAAYLGARALPYLLLGVMGRMTFVGGRHGVGLLAVPAGVAWSWMLALLLIGLGNGAAWRAPTAVETFLPLLGCTMGVLLAGAFERPLVRVLPSLVGRALLVVVALGFAIAGLGAAVLGGGSAELPAASLSLEEKRALIEQLRGQNPLGLEPGARTLLELDTAELGALLAWGVLLMDDQGRAQLRESAEGVAWQASLALPVVPGLRRQLTLGGDLALDVKDGVLHVQGCGFSAGALRLAPWLCRSLLGSVFRSAATSRDFGPFVAALDWLTIDGSGLAARYTRPRLDEQTALRLQALFGPGLEVRSAAAAQFDLLQAHAPDLRRQEDRFAAILQAAFELAERRSEAGNPVAENQGLILALATILGHHEIATLAGIERPEDWRRIRDVLAPVTLRDRPDWVRHFMVSAALTQLSAAVVSDAAGLLKEELDAARGSGFSFGDLLADRAGRRFGELAVRSPRSAIALQKALAHRWGPEQLMPPAEGLPEGLSDSELERRYGGVGGAGYESIVQDIDARIGRLPVP